MSNIKLEKLRDRIIQKYGSDYNNSFIITNTLTVMQNNLKRFAVHQTFNNRIRIVYHTYWIDFNSVSSVMDFINNNILGD